MIVSSLLGLVFGVGLAALLTLLFGGLLHRTHRTRRHHHLRPRPAHPRHHRPGPGARRPAHRRGEAAIQLPQHSRHPARRPVLQMAVAEALQDRHDIQAIDITWDPDIRQETIEAVTKDNLTVQISGQIRWKPAERNLYAYLFGIAHPAAHVVGYFISVLRDRIATFHGESAEGSVEGVSFNDLRRNLSLINTFMEESCRKTAARYGIDLDAALITNIDPPADVDEALASINTTQNQVAASISQAKADADQKLKMAEQAVQIATNRAQAEAAPLLELGKTLEAMHAQGGKAALDSYLRNASLPLREKAAQTIIKL
ncbi:MAG: SPFH domain-containing protein [Lacunisphaera sp.]